MLKIVYNPQKKIYKNGNMPYFKTSYAKKIWKKNEKIKRKTFNIRYVSIDKQDISNMRYSNNKYLLNLYERYKDDDTNSLVINNNKYNYLLIYSLINTFWLVKENNITNKSDDALKNEIDNINYYIDLISQRKSKGNISSYLNNNLKLLNYKKNTINELINKKCKIKK